MNDQLPTKPNERILKIVFLILLLLPFAWCFVAGLFLLPHYLEQSKSPMLLARMARWLNGSTGIPFRESVWIVLWIPFFCAVPLAQILRRGRRRNESQ